jgi:Methyladenine glycosylase
METRALSPAVSQLSADENTSKRVSDFSGLVLWNSVRVGNPSLVEKERFARHFVKDVWPCAKSRPTDTPVEHPLMLQYHDREWGILVHHDGKHFECLVLEAAQAGLSWTIVLKK